MERKVLDTSKHRASNSIYEQRISTLPDLHKITGEQIKAFKDAISLEDLELQGKVRALDLFAGNGFSAKIALEESVRLNRPMHMSLVDALGDFTTRASNQLADSVDQFMKEKLEVDSLQLDLGLGVLPFEDSSIDLITIKMGLHEIPFERQQLLAKELFRVLSTGGRVVIWGNHVEKYSKNNEDIIGFNTIIKFKDTLSCSARAAQEIYFTSSLEVLDILSTAGFNPVIIYEWIRRWESLTRLEIELNSDINKLIRLNNIIDKQFSQKWKRNKYNFVITSNKSGINGRCFDLKAGIIVAHKL